MLITLTTDFGYRDSFVGVMKGVIAGINPRAQVIDLTHGIPPQDIIAGALTLHHSVKFFPRGSIHVVVVDPGVGGARRALLIDSGENYFIGPDNGVLSLAAATGTKRLIHLTNPAYHLKSAGTTFHGRDIFAPVAAHLSLGLPTEAFGETLSSFVEISIPAVIRGKDRMEGEIIYIDGYGNLFTNVSADDLTGLPQFRLHLTIGSTTICGLVSSYDAVGEEQLAAVVNSWGKLEIGAYKGNAQQKCNAKVGDRIILTWSL